MKKLLFVVESLSGGGAEKVLLTLVEHLEKSKYDVTVFTVVKTGVYVNELEQYCTVDYGLKDYTEYSLLGKIYYKIKLNLIYKLNIKLVYKWLIKDKYDVEIAFVEGFDTKLVAASNNKQSIKLSWIHTDMLENKFADRYFKNKQCHLNCYKKYDKIIGVSEGVKNAFIKKFNYKNIEVQYNPINEREIIAKAYPAIEYSLEYINFITVGRLVEQKGYDRLLRIVNKLKKYKFKLYILGEGPLRNQFEEYIEENGLSDKIFLLGFQDNPYKYMVNASAFICSSYAEGFSTVATESLILNLPIITTDCSGMQELFGTYECGIICHNNEDSLYESVKKILDYPDVLNDYKVQIKERKKYFQLEKRMREIENKI